MATLDEFTVIVAPTLREAESELKKNQFAAILVDIELPDGDGIRFLSTLLEDRANRQLPVMILSGHGDIQNKVAAFSLGADDFIVKPFDPRELKARVRAKVGRSAALQELKKVRQFGRLEIDLDRQRAFERTNHGEVDLGLTTIEFRILVHLTKRLEQVFTREQIIAAVWGETNITDRTVDSHVAHLRQKLRNQNLAIETLKNLGYRATLKS